MKLQVTFSTTKLPDGTCKAIGILRVQSVLNVECHLVHDKDYVVYYKDLILGSIREFVFGDIKESLIDIADKYPDTKSDIRKIIKDIYIKG